MYAFGTSTREISRYFEREFNTRLPAETISYITDRVLPEIKERKSRSLDADVILIDDMVDTAGTITKAADLMKECGARSVRAMASHGVMSGPANDRVQNSALEEMVFTDSIPYTASCEKVKQISIADMMAETIRRVLDNESISSQYLM